MFTGAMKGTNVPTGTKGTGGQEGNANVAAAMVGTGQIGDNQFGLVVAANAGQAAAVAGGQGGGKGGPGGKGGKGWSGEGGKPEGGAGGKGGKPEGGAVGALVAGMGVAFVGLGGGGPPPIGGGEHPVIGAQVVAAKAAGPVPQAAIPDAELRYMGWTVDEWMQHWASVSIQDWATAAAYNEGRGSKWTVAEWITHYGVEGNQPGGEEDRLRWTWWCRERVPQDGAMMHGAWTPAAQAAWAAANPMVPPAPPHDPIVDGPEMAPQAQAALAAAGMQQAAQAQADLVVLQQAAGRQQQPAGGDAGMEGVAEYVAGQQQAGDDGPPAMIESGGEMDASEDGDQARRGAGARPEKGDEERPRGRRAARRPESVEAAFCRRAAKAAGRARARVGGPGVSVPRARRGVKLCGESGEDRLPRPRWRGRGGVSLV